MKNEVKNVGASVLAKLQNKAEGSKQPFAEILQYYGMERFLYRLSQSEYAEQFILKGALMFTAWDVPERRTTRDIDFLARLGNELAVIENVVKGICQVQVVPDGITFDPDTTRAEKIKEDADYEGIRVKFRGFVDRALIPMQIDFGFGDIVYPRPRAIDYPAILDFPKPHLKGYTAESVVSEKFESMIYLGSANSRMKDFYDLWLLARRFDFKGADLAGAIKKTFDRRKTPLPQGAPLFTEEIYDEQSDRQGLWKAFLSKRQINHAPEQLSMAAKSIEDFLVKPLEVISKDQVFKEVWKASGPWHP
ncbi:MAG: nucleotidyl transferase AbiEii/AbiGii toxin family protein [Candidatus Omnitrophica bacterium]|nr:nucleotidyl transferase AbiEii/AbiGii toxin family protein [Candidatus Omnitrophota bacterium]